MISWSQGRGRRGITVRLLPRNGSHAHGTATLRFVGRDTLRTSLDVSGLEPGSRHPAHIHFGSCAGGGPIGYPLNDLVAGPGGEARGVTDTPGVYVVPPSGWFVNVHQGPTLAGEGATPIACGDVAPARPIYP